MTQTKQQAGPTGMALHQGVHHFNKQNWTGENAAIRVRKDGSFDYQGYTVTLVPHGDSKTDGLTMFTILEDDRRTGTLAKWADEPAWVASSDFSDLSRSDTVPQVAVAKLMSNQ